MKPDMLCPDMVLMYDPKDNYIFDANGGIIYDIFRIIRPNDLFLFKHTRQNRLIRGINGQLVELCCLDWRD